MAKYTPTALTSSYGSVAAINTNLDAISTALENTLSRDGTTPNTMSASLDMNNQTILNLPDPTTPGEPVTLRIYDASSSPNATAAAASAAAALISKTNAAASEAAALASANNAAVSETNAAVSETNSAASAAGAVISADASAASAALAASYTSMGFGGTLLDLGQVADAVVYFPTDLGVLV